MIDGLSCRLWLLKTGETRIMTRPRLGSTGPLDLLDSTNSFLSRGRPGGPGSTAPRREHVAEQTVQQTISAELAESRGDVGETVQRLVRKKPWEPYLGAARGFRNHWYPALFSHELAEGEVKGANLLGERIAFKRVDGRVYALEDRCA